MNVWNRGSRMKKDIILNAAVIHNGISEVLQNHGDELSSDEINSLEQVIHFCY